MTVKAFKTEEYYETIAKWWESHGFPVLGMGFLPDDILVHSNDQGIDTHAIFPYHTNSDILWLGFPVSDKRLPFNKRKGGLERLMKGAVEYAKALGFKYVFTTSPVQVVQEGLLKAGFKHTDSNVNHYVKTL